MDTKKAPVVPGLIALAIIVAAGAFWYAHRSPVASVSQPSVAMTATTSPTEETLDPASVSNLEAVKAAFDTNAQSAHYYTIDFTNVAKISYEGRDMYLGNLQDTYGNGMVENAITPAFIFDGVLYRANSWSGNTYPRPTTNWVVRYSDMSVNQFQPAELGAGDTEVALTYPLKTGIKEIDLKEDAQGNISYIAITDQAGSTQQFDSPTPIATFNIVTEPQFAGAPDLVTYQNQTTRVLPGETTGGNTYVADTGYTIQYPAMLNGLAVERVHQGQYSDYFSTQDVPNNGDSASMWCTQSDQDQVGPKTGNPVAIAPASLPKLVDWGTTEFYHGDIFSFTGPGFYCQIQTQGAFRPDMFQISF